MLPESGRKMPVIIRMVVVFPAPLRPRRPVMVPCRTVKETPSTALTTPNVLTTSRTAKTTDIRRNLAEGLGTAAYCTRGRGQGLGGMGVVSSNGDGEKIFFSC